MVLPWLSEEFLNPIISKTGEHIVLLLINYMASQLLGIAQPVTRCAPRKNSLLFHKINPLWTKLVQSGWLDIGIVYVFIYLFFCFVDATLNADWLVSNTHCIFCDLTGFDKLSYIF